MAFKDVKAGLKAAKDAVSKEEYREVLRICEAIFDMDASCYMACIFTGLAYLKLGNAASSKQYYKRAIELQPDERLGWKGLADFYDKQKPTVDQEMEDAIITYKRLLQYLDTDLEKKYLTWTKLASLEGKRGNVKEALIYYHLSVESQYPNIDLWVEVINYLSNVAEEELDLMSAAIAAVMKTPSISMETRTKLKELYILKLHKVYKSRAIRDEDLELKIKKECQDYLADSSSYNVMSVVASLFIDKIVPNLRLSEEIVIPEDMQEYLTKLYTSTAGSADMDNVSDAIGSLVQVLLCMANGKWKEAKDLVQKALNLCEGRVVAGHVCYYFHDHTIALNHLQEGQGMISSVSTFLRKEYDWQFQIYLAACYIDTRSQKSTAIILPSLHQLIAIQSFGSEARVLLVKAYILLGRLDEAQSLLEALGSENHVYWALKGELLHGRKEYTAALECWNLALKMKPSCAKYHLQKGIVLWEIPSSDKLEGYRAILEAAKLDPYDANVFLYIGHYLIGSDSVRAVKCYEKALGLKPSSSETLLQLGDAFFSTGDLDTAYTVYSKLLTDPGPFTKQVYMKIGLYHRRKGDNTAAIQCFQNILQTDPQDRHCWECLGEAYLSRGSLNSSLEAFSEVLKLEGQSLNTWYQIANIKKIQGLFVDAVKHYTAVLKIDSSYVPALKGRGESSLSIAVSALKEGLNGRAMDNVSFALKDLTKAAWLRPQFVCIWKLIGDCCTCLYDQEEDGFRITVPTVLVDSASDTQQSDCTTVQKLQIFHIAKRAYGRAVQLNPGASLHWHDLAMSHYYLGKQMQNIKYFQTAFQLMQKALTVGSNYLHWIGLGLIAKSLSNFSLTQHAFIKSIQLESNNPTAWSNLGAFYLEQGKTQIAHEAFKCAQSLDPTYVQAWIGQAMIADAIGHNETMDLFRHATELAYHPQGAVGYGYWVCHNICTIERKLIVESDGAALNVTAQSRVLQARDSLDKCVRSCHKDLCVYNYLGLLYELEGLLKPSMMAFLSALELSKGLVESDNRVVKIKLNCARVQSALGRHLEAEALYCSLVATADVVGKLDMALALFRASKLQDSVEMYHLLIESEDATVNRSALYTGAAMASYLIGRDLCKEKLFTAFNTSPPSLHGLVALAVLGSLNNDQALVHATAVEILRIIELDSNAVSLLHCSCMLALKCVQFSLQNNNEAKDSVVSVISKLPSVMMPQHPLTPQINVMISMDLDRLSLCASDIAEAQKMVHMYPANPCYLGVLVHMLRNNRDELKAKYKAVVLMHVTTILSVESCDVRHQILQRTLDNLKQTVSLM